MSCSGLHCSGCGAGMTLPPLGFAVAFGVAWVAEHLIEVAIVSATCGILSVAAIMALLRWADRRDARYAGRRSLLITRADVIPLAPAAMPQVTQPERPAVPQVVNFNFFGADGIMAARAIRDAIPGPSGVAAQKGE